MAKGNNQRLKLLYLAKILLEETDELHGMVMSEIIQRLADVGITADRKTIYTDIDELRRFGMDIVCEHRHKKYVYFVASRDFELVELKLLVDSVQAAKFITEKKSKALIKKLSTLSSKNEAKQLRRQVFINGRIKTMNESIYYNVDKIYSAINANSKIRFQYFRWNVEKEQELRRDGEWYYVSPWYLIWDDEYYYLVAFDDRSKIIKHYRVDKMLRITMLNKEREGKEALSNSDAAAYSKTHFGMFGGKTRKVVIEAENDCVGILIDRFGREIPIVKLDETHFKTDVEVVPSNLFLSWIMSFGDKIKITAPENVVEDLKNLLRNLNETYKE